MTTDDGTFFKELAKHYYNYIETLNQNRPFPGSNPDILEPFVQERILYNSKQMTRLEYTSMLAGDFRSAPNLNFSVDIKAMNGDFNACWIAVRLMISCTPVEREFVGIPVPEAKQLEFYENVFYLFKEKKIEEVESVIDRKGIEEQLAQRGG